MIGETDFLNMLNTLNVAFYSKKEDRYSTSMVYRKGPPTMDCYVYAHWVIGGETGGSCWDDGTEDRHYPREAEREPDLVELDTILAKFVPDLSFLSYRKLMRDVVEYDGYTESEYYGNYTTYSYKCVQLRKLYDWLKNEGDVAGGTAGKREDASRKRASKNRS